MGSGTVTCIVEESNPVEAASPVSVIVVSFNTSTQLRRCLAAIERKHEVIVVDNASSDGSADMVVREFPHVALITNAENRGFGAANNQGIAQAKRDLILLLNSDAYASPGSIDRLAGTLSDPNIAAVGGKLTYPDGRLQNSTAQELKLSHVFWEQSLLSRFSGYWTTSSEWTQPHEVEQVMGACLMFRRGAAEFDERFFLYCEDSDLCLRLRQKGRIVYVPAAIFVHELGSSTSREPWRGISAYNRSKELYFRIHHGAASAILCRILNRGGALLRLALWPGVTLAQKCFGKRSVPWLTWVRVLFGV